MRCFRRVNSTAVYEIRMYMCAAEQSTANMQFAKDFFSKPVAKDKIPYDTDHIIKTASLEENQIVHFPSPNLIHPLFRFPSPSIFTPLIIDVNNFMRIRIAPDNVFGSSRSLALPRVANESLSPLPKAFGETLHGSNHITAPLCTKEDRKFEP